jgi:hypothetical protein
MYTNLTHPQIIWEKWRDPFGHDVDETQWTSYEEEEHNEVSAQSEYFQQNGKKPIKVIASPMGLIPYNEHTASSKIFNFWLGHTNFNISKKIAQDIEKIDGVEILDVFTRYRFRIGVGKCFKDQNVMNDIQNSINVLLNGPKFTNG